VSRSSDDRRLPLRHILVDIDARASRHPALDQAVDLARRCGARVTVVSVIAEVPGAARAYITARLEAELGASRQKALDAVAVRYRKSGVEVTTAVLRGRPATALVKAVVGLRADLVVRWHARDVAAGRDGLSSVDMQLMRKCPCPVWIVGVGERMRPRRILAAIHPDPGDAVEQALNRRIVDAGQVIAELEGGSLTLLNTWAPYGESLLRTHMTPADLRASVAAARQGARAALDAFLGDIGPLGKRTKVEFLKGQPGEVIPRYCRREDIDLVIMGTVARRGLVGLLMGNTAEQMMQRLRCSVFALKPEGFSASAEA
jgi:nucleotide-binding universal stress UspA family protein